MVDQRFSSQPRQSFINLPFILLLILIAVIGFWFLDDRRSNMYDPDAVPRVITPRGSLMEEETSTIALFENAAPSVVYITTLALQSDFLRWNVLEIPQGTGSGFVWDTDGHIVTNHHVVAAALRSGKVRVQLDDRSEWDAVIIGSDPNYDLAVLHIDAPASRMKPITIGTAEDLKVGQRVFAIGNPFGFDHSLTTGIVSALDREVLSEAGQRISGLIQTDAAINPGNSGGPLLDSASRLIGVNTFIVSDTGAFSGIGFAIPVDLVNVVVTDLLRTGNARRPGLGVTISADMVTRNMGFNSGVMILEVLPGSAAEQAGLRSAVSEYRQGRKYIDADVIIGIDGTQIVSSKDLLQVLGLYIVGDSVKVTFLRNNEAYETTVTLQAIN